MRGSFETAGCPEPRSVRLFLPPPPPKFANFGGGGGKNSLTDRGSGQPAVSNDPRIENMRPGGVFSLRGVGPNMDDFDVSVVGRHVYDEDGFQWLEIEGDAGTQRLWVTVEDDDEVEVSVTLRKAPSAR